MRRVTLLALALVAGPLAARQPPEVEPEIQIPPEVQGQLAPPPPAPPAKAEEPKRDPGPPISGQFKTKDHERQTVTLAVDGKDRTFKVIAATKFHGAKGARSGDRLRDDRLDKGYAVTIVPDAKDDAVVVEVKLAPRQAPAKGM